MTGDITPGFTVNSRRLFAVADALLDAVRSPHGFRTQVSVRAGSDPVVGSWGEGPFTLEELTEAMAVLVRIGLVPKDQEVPRDMPRALRAPRRPDV